MARIVINPKVFGDARDAKCVAWNEAFRVVMEDMSFEPASEPTEEQRKFFSDTAYRNDEIQLRRTILARVCTFDDSVENPTDEQLQEAVEFLDSVMEAGVPQTEEEQATVQRARDMIAAIVSGGGGTAQAPGGAAEPPPEEEPPEGPSEPTTTSGGEPPEDRTTPSAGPGEPGGAPAQPA